ncbi:hypothetical protein ES332_D03G161600v1 [Gossypium tomentosum]|uniref:Uncharacterized protein n=1 Tax=Gossypium tomentosum TaxID=34277 RepID=A0A5D2LQE4_GOSTO|nr:hypothetical protein ES332_D03G161600v1 [Gossypium tomentosum]
MNFMNLQQHLFDTRYQPDELSTASATLSKQPRATNALKLLLEIQGTFSNLKAKPHAKSDLLTPKQPVLLHRQPHGLRYTISPVTTHLPPPTFQRQDVRRIVDRPGHKVGIPFHQQSPKAHHACKE